MVKKQALRSTVLLPSLDILLKMFPDFGEAGLFRAGRYDLAGGPPSRNTRKTPMQSLQLYSPPPLPTRRPAGHSSQLASQTHLTKKTSAV